MERRKTIFKKWLLMYNCFTYRLPISKCPFKKSLNGNMCCSLLNSTWLAMFCRILDISMRPRLTAGGTCFVTMPISWGETIAGLMNLKNITVPTAPILFCGHWGNLLLNTWYKQWHMDRSCGGNLSAELTMASKTFWVRAMRFCRLRSMLSCNSNLQKE